MTIFRHRRSACLIVLWLLAAAMLAPVVEVGDLLEAVFAVPGRPSPATTPAPQLASHDIEPCQGSHREEPGLVLGRYAVTFGSKVVLGPTLEPLFRILDQPRSDSSEVWATWRDLERGPPAAT